MSFPHTVGRILELAAAAVPNQLSATLGDESLTFAESELRAQRMAAALSSLGLAQRRSPHVLGADLSAGARCVLGNPEARCCVRAVQGQALAR